MISVQAQRRITNMVAQAMMYVSTFVGLFFLAWILWTTLKMGVSALHWDLFINDTPPPGTSGFGLRNAFAGSLLLMGIALAIGMPVGVMAGTWLAEYGGESRIANAVRFLNDILLAAPSIEIGLFAYAIIVAPMGHFSAFAGSVALSVLMMPIIVRTTDEMLKLVGNELREAAIALGAPIWSVIMKITWKAARVGILTGILLALARISGETAPLLFTALNNQYFSMDLNHAIANLPVVIFQFAMSPYTNWQQMAWAGAFIAIMFVLVVSVSTRMLLQRAFKKL